MVRVGDQGVFSTVCGRPAPRPSRFASASLPRTRVHLHSSACLRPSAPCVWIAVEELFGQLAIPGFTKGNEDNACTRLVACRAA